LGLFFVSGLSCQARLGEILDQCIARYGDPVPQKEKTPVPGGVGDSMAVFHKNGFILTMIFLKGTVGAEVVSKDDGSDLSDNEEQNLLDADSASMQWTKPDGVDPTGTVWFRDDKAVARYDIVQHALTLESKEFWDAAQAKKKADEDNSTKGF
jgi:hypothetical protein